MSTRNRVRSFLLPSLVLILLGSNSAFAFGNQDDKRLDTNIVDSNDIGPTVTNGPSISTAQMNAEHKEYERLQKLDRDYTRIVLHGGH